MKPLRQLTGEECNAEIRRIQKEMCLAENSDQRDKMRGQIAMLAKEAAFKNRNVFRVTNDD